MSDAYWCAGGCGRFLPATEIGITGLCGECWRKWLDEYDTRMKAMRERMRQEAIETRDASKGGDQR
ncbi:MAG TPA: hypothetical protein GX506_00340 [Firmicutes bacterium]|nr:hypothetical protein [Bacillota bacterium]